MFQQKSNKSKTNISRKFSSEIESEKENFWGGRDFNATYKLVFLHEQDNSLIEDKEEFNFNDYYFLKNLSKTDNKGKPISSLKSMNKSNKKLYFTINYENRDALFTKVKNNCLFDKNGKTFFGTKRNKTRRKRRDNKDNVLKKIKRNFLNTALINKLNHKSRIIGSKLYFDKFPQLFVSDVDQKRNKKILNIIN